MIGRLQSLRELLRNSELDGVIITKPENRVYYSGFTGSSGLLLITFNDAKLLTDFRYIEQAGKQAPDFQIIRHGSDMFETLQNQLRLSGLEKVGFEGDYITWDSHKRLNEIAPQAVSVHLDGVRMVKDEAELALIKRAVELADNAFTHILPFFKPGVRERDIALELEFHMRKNGAEKSAFDIITASGTRSALPHGQASDKIIAVGDLVTMDFGAVYQGYHSDITRTVVIGKAAPKQREIYELVLTAQLAGVAAIVPGIPCREVDAVARTIISEAGYGEFFGHGLGHGLGLAIHEEPRLSPPSEVILASGMVVTVEPGIYLPDWGGVRIEDTVVVSSAGAKVLTASSKKLIELDW